jgi:hypothetical protein
MTMTNANFGTLQSRDSVNGSAGAITTAPSYPMSNHSVGPALPLQQSTAGIVTPQEPSLLFQQYQHQPLQQPPQQGYVSQTSQSFFAQQVITSMQLQQQEHQLHQQQQQQQQHNLFAQFNPFARAKHGTQRYTFPSESQWHSRVSVRIDTTTIQPAESSVDPTAATTVAIEQSIRGAHI